MRPVSLLLTGVMVHHKKEYWRGTDARREDKHDSFSKTTCIIPFNLSVFCCRYSMASRSKPTCESTYHYHELINPIPTSPRSDSTQFAVLSCDNVFSGSSETQGVFFCARHYEFEFSDMDWFPQCKVNSKW